MPDEPAFNAPDGSPVPATPTSEPTIAPGPASETPHPRHRHHPAWLPKPPTWRPKDLLASFVKPSRSQLLMALILLLCGLAGTMQVRSNAADSTYTSLRRDDLIAMLDTLDSETRHLESQIATLEETKRQLQSGADKQAIARAEAVKRLGALGVLAGTLPAQGPGIRITLNDPLNRITPEMLLDAVEEMRDAGAEVIDLNGKVRVVASTWFASGPLGLIVDDQVLSRPIVIRVIGDPNALEEAARFRGGLVSQVQDSSIGGTVTIVRSDAIAITSIRTIKAAQFAQPG